MNPTATSETDYKQLFSQLIKKQMLVLGPDITLAKVRNVSGLTVDQNGEVTGVEGDPQQLLQGLINQFVELSGMIVKKTMESILTSYPGMMTMAATGALGGIQATSQSQPQSQTQQTVTQDISRLDIKPEVSSQSPTNSVDKVQASSSTVKPQEPPAITDMKLDSFSPSQDKPRKEATFTDDDMAKLNKALDELSNAPVAQDETTVK